MMHYVLVSETQPVRKPSEPGSHHQHLMWSLINTCRTWALWRQVTQCKALYTSHFGHHFCFNGHFL